MGTKNREGDMKAIKLTLVFLVVLSSVSFSQLKEGKSLLGPTIGFWFYNSVPTFGINYEYQTKQLGETGVLGVGGIFRYTGWKDENPYWEWSYSYITFGAQANLNFNKIGDGKFVPFVGLVLGYNAVSSSVTYKGSGYSSTAGYSSGLWTWGQAGARYFVSPQVALVARVGLGNFNYYALELGADFRF
jgi:hypothetical protein